MPQEEQCEMSNQKLKNNLLREILGKKQFPSNRGVTEKMLVLTSVTSHMKNLKKWCYLQKL